MREEGTFSHVVAIATLGGLLFGCHIGYAGVAMQLLRYVEDCNSYRSASACNSTSICYWEANSCRFRDQPLGVMCGDHNVSSSCSATPDCFWNKPNTRCDHRSEWDDNDLGLFSGMMIVGALISSLPAGSLADRFGRRRSITAAGVLGILSAVLLIVGWQFESPGQLSVFWLLVLGRFVAGVAVGIVSVVTPLYVGEASPESHLAMTGCLFQIFVTLGIFLVAIIGVALHRCTDSFHDYSHAKELVHVENVLLLICASLYALAGYKVAEPAEEADCIDSFSPSGRPLVVQQRVSENELSPMVTSSEAPRSLLRCIRTVPWWSLRVHLLSALLLSAVQQLTGINAIMNYAPALSNNFSVEPLLGNAVIMFWNFITTVVSIRLTANYSVGQVFIGGGLIASISCFAAGIPTLPVVFSDGNNVGFAITAVAIGVFIAAFEAGMGPHFYVLSQSLFPASWRSQGCSFTLVTQFAFNVMINWGYPVLVTSLSGGENGNQRQGTAIMFFAFGAIGLICTLSLWYLIRHRPK